MGLLTKNAWFVILNPASRMGKSYKIWQKTINPLLQQLGIKYELYQTTAPLHAAELVQQAAAQGYTQILAVGGDGLLHEVVNGLMKLPAEKRPLLGVIPCGTGNDWVKTLGIPVQPQKSLAAFRTGKIKSFDVAKVNVSQPNGTSSNFYSCNVAGAGFDGYVAQAMLHWPNAKRWGRASYFAAILKSMWAYKNVNCTVTTNEGQIYEGPLYLMAAGIGKFVGGGMMLCPNASPHDGLLDVTLIKGLNKLQVLQQLPNLYNGKFIGHPQIAVFTCKWITINAETPLYLQAEGELLGHTPIRIEINPEAIQVVVPN